MPYVRCFVVYTLSVCLIVVCDAKDMSSFSKAEDHLLCSYWLDCNLPLMRDSEQNKLMPPLLNFVAQLFASTVYQMYKRKCRQRRACTCPVYNTALYSCQFSVKALERVI